MKIWASLVAQMVKNVPTMQETWVKSLGWEDSLEKEMATHSSIFAWEIPWTELPRRLQWDDKRAAAAATKSLQSCPTLCDPMDSSPPSSSVYGILHARILTGVGCHSLLQN